ncbi:N-acyl homoserine lactonase family protein [Lysobacter sp. TY2-98]|uniref:N-acyl homoserine lactonase family protein n=1 Tax=Lysobacter sp. TY2-98 TaxID=2290922 RepID=UPI000E1FFF80|nr:N-acyl homoserine lactonase family protein [Lysobacter sp. TY2-98]AXK73618.1 N-acyl homoserine lactonase family protein [Lysobacter sp. TY2-98]
MKTLFLAALGLSGAMTAPAHAADVALARLDCGNEPQPVSVASFSDTLAYPDLKLPLTYSCYVIRHGDRYIVWDTGNPRDGEPEAPKTALVDLLAQAHVPVDAVDYVGISHYHHDHTGQLASLPEATLLIGGGDWDAIRAMEPPVGVDAKAFASRRAPFAPWLSGGAKVDPVRGDRKDVFGDGSVVIISLPGHTPGHSGLLVKLEKSGYVLLSGDVTHFHENYDTDGVPAWNTSRADSLASLDRFRRIARNLHATVIIQHDPRDIAKLPAFPEFAK